MPTLYKTLNPTGYYSIRLDQAYESISLLIDCFLKKKINPRIEKFTQKVRPKNFMSRNKKVREKVRIKKNKVKKNLNSV